MTRQDETKHTPTLEEAVTWIRRVQPHLHEYGMHISLGGSVLNGTARPGSDMDMIVGCSFDYTGERPDPLATLIVCLTSSGFAPYIGYRYLANRLLPVPEGWRVVQDLGPVEGVWWLGPGLDQDHFKTADLPNRPFTSWGPAFVYIPAYGVESAKEIYLMPHQPGWAFANSMWHITAFREGITWMDAVIGVDLEPMPRWVPIPFLTNQAHLDHLPQPPDLPQWPGAMLASRISDLTWPQAAFLAHRVLLFFIRLPVCTMGLYRLWGTPSFLPMAILAHGVFIGGPRGMLLPQWAYLLGWLFLATLLTPSG